MFLVERSEKKELMETTNEQRAENALRCSEWKEEDLLHMTPLKVDFQL